MAEITLPWPPSGCHPNISVRMHWAKKGAARKSYRQDCAWIAKTVPYKPTDGNIQVRIMFHPPGKQGDIDNMLAAIKGGIDGICETWGINDKRLRPITIDVGEPVKGGCVIITIEPKQA